MESPKALRSWPRRPNHWSGCVFRKPPAVAGGFALGLVDKRAVR